MATILELTKGKKFNSKIYGRINDYSIYVNSDKIEVSNEQVQEYNLYLKEIESFKANYPEVLNSRACQNIAIKAGIEHEFVELSFEQEKAKMALFEIENKTAKKGNVEVALQIAKYEGKVVCIYVKSSVGYEDYIDDEANIKDIINLVK